MGVAQGENRTNLRNGKRACSMQPWSYGCTPEVAKHERSIRVAECGSSFLSAYQLNLPSAYITPWLHSCNVYHFFYNIIKREKHYFPFAFSWVIGPSSCMLPSAHPFELFFRWINCSPSSGKLQNVLSCYSEWHLSTCS